MMILSLLCWALLLGHSHGAMSAEEKMCTKDMWQYLPKNGISVKLFGKGTLGSNRDTCKKYLGHLITLDSIEKLDEVAQWIATKYQVWKNRQIRVGLTRKQGNTFVWDSGASFNNEAFELKPINGRDCVSYQRHREGSWTSSSCNDMAYGLCESPGAEPCTGHGVLFINGEKIFDSSYRSIKPGTTTIECYYETKGKESVTEIALKCPDFQRKTGKVQKRLSHSFLFTEYLHREQCTCTVVINRKKSMQRVYLSYLSSPRLTNISESNQTIMAPHGSDASVYFVVVAFPHPFNFTLTKTNGTIIPEDEYVLLMGPHEKPLHTAITVEFLSVHQGHTGDYTFAIENGLDPNLEVSFAINVKEFGEVQSNSGLFFYFFLFVILCLIIGAGVAASYNYKVERAATIVSTKRSTKLSSLKRSVVYTINDEEEEGAEEAEEEEDESEDDDHTVATGEFRDFHFEPDREHSK